MSSVAGTGPDIRSVVRRALEEDAYCDDATCSAVVPEGVCATGTLVAKEPGVLAGRAYAEEALRQCDAGLELEWLRRDGERLAAGDVVMRCEGSARGLLAGERVALNFLQHLSGIATHAARLVELAGPVAVLDTRKTLPGLRAAQKAAVLAGGGRNHRRDLSDQLLLKENHFAVSGLGFRETVERAVARAQGKTVGVEVRSLDEGRAALEAGAHYVLLDNFSADALRETVTALRRDHAAAELEASGGIRVDTVSSLAASGVDRLSVGALTHSSPALDLSFSLVRAEPQAGGSG